MTRFRTVPKMSLTGLGWTRLLMLKFVLAMHNVILPILKLGLPVRNSVLHMLVCVACTAQAQLRINQIRWATPFV